MAGYEFRHEAVTPSRHPVTITQVPPEFAKALDGQWKLVQTKPVIPVIDFADAKEVAFHLAYAKAWGMSKPEGEQVTVTKRTRKEDKEGTLRLSMVKYDPNAPKRGRRSTAAAAE
jgi:hypothetical protein